MASALLVSHSISAASLIGRRLELRLIDTQICVPIAQRTISNCSIRALKESTEDNPGNMRHKYDSLSKQKAGRGHWKPELATESEEAIKADRAEETANNMDKIQAMKVLQDRTKGTAEKILKTGTSMSEGV